jgi:hypothetical protein
MTGGQVIEVANYDRWPGYRGGQLYSFHCISTTLRHHFCFNLTFSLLRHSSSLPIYIPST